MKELGITKGEWFWDGDPSNYDPEEEAPWLVAGDRAEKIVIYGEIKIANKKDAELIADAGNTAQKCGLLPSELLQQRDELREALAEQKRLYFNLFDEEISCMYCEAKIRRGSAIILCKECAENTEG